MISPELLRAATACSVDRSVEVAPHLNEACRAFDITTEGRLAPFLGEIAHESGSLRHVVELASGEAYEGRRDLGNTQPGDGPRYRGRGFIQLTGRANARRATLWLRDILGAEVPDFEAQPDALQDVRWASWVAAAFWFHNGLNGIADEGEGSWDDISSVINTGRRGRVANHLVDRRLRRARAADALRSFNASAPAVAGRDAGTTVPRKAEAPPIASEWDLQNPPKEPAMHPAITFTAGLASTLIDVFAPLAREKVREKMSREGVDPAAAEQIANGVVEAAKKVTKIEDPVQAVAKAKSDPGLVEQVQAATLDDLNKLAPLLDKLHRYDREEHEATDASRDAAARRAAAMPAGTDQDPYLTRAVVHMMVGVMVGLAVLSAVLKYLGVDVQMIVGTLLTLAGVVATSYRDRYGHRYGSSSGSSAKDVTIEALAQQRQRK